MVVTCSASAISRSVSVAKFAAAVVMNALIRSGCAFAYPSRVAVDDFYRHSQPVLCKVNGAVMLLLLIIKFS